MRAVDAHRGGRDILEDLPIRLASTDEVVGAVAGLVEGDRIRQLTGDLFGSWSKSDKTYARNEVKLLTPTVPTQPARRGTSTS